MVENFEKKNFYSILEQGGKFMLENFYITGKNSCTGQIFNPSHPLKSQMVSPLIDNVVTVPLYTSWVWLGHVVRPHRMYCTPPPDCEPRFPFGPRGPTEPATPFFPMGPRGPGTPVLDPGTPRSPAWASF